MQNKQSGERTNLSIDIEQAYQFLEQLDGQAPAFTFQAFDDDKKRKSPKLARIFNGPLGDLMAQFKALQNEGAGIFVTVNETDLSGRKDKNMVRARCVWQEDDEGWQGAFPLPPSMVIESSKGKFHRYWLLAEGEELSQREHAAILDRLVRDYGSDNCAKGFNRVLRLPGFLHQKGKPFLTRIMEISGKRYTREELLAAFPPPETGRAEKMASRGEGGIAPDRGKDDKPSSHEIAEALSHIPAENRQTWLDVGMALHDFYGGSSDGYALWDEWSQGAADKYDAKSQKTTWSSFKGSGHTIKTIFELARQHGCDLGELARKYKASPVSRSNTQRSPDAQSSKQRTEHELPYGYQYKKNGDIEFQDGEDEDDSPEWHRLCSPLEITASTRDSDDKNHGLLLRVKTSGGYWHEWSMPMEMLAGSGEEYRRFLLSLGLRLSAGSKIHRKLQELLSRSEPVEKALNVSRIGWHGQTFVLPDAVFGEKSGERVVYQSGAVLQHAFRSRGTLDIWRNNIARLAGGNSRLVVSISAAFAAPLLELVGMESGGLHFRGGSSSGKTTALKVAGSVWGGGGVKGYVKSWRTTDNGLEGVAVAHSDALLCLDELAQVSPEAAAKAVYMLGNEQGKQRLNRSGVARSVAEWRLLFLSSGELSLADKIAQSHRPQARIMAGQQVRFIDLSADAGKGYGLFENCHECGRDSRKFSDLLKENAALSYGVAARAFLSKLVRQDFEEIRRAIFITQTRFVDAVARDADGQVQRVAQRFALMAAGGDLATRWGITGWRRDEALGAAKRCFCDWLAARGTNGPAELIDGLAQVRSFIEANGNSRFEHWEGEGDRPTINRVGFRREQHGDTLYYILPEAWKREVCKGFDHQMIARALLERDTLVPGEAGHLQKKVRLPGMRNPARCYVLKSNIMESGSNGRL